MRIFVIVVIVSAITNVSLAQRNTTPGLPWTYVTPDSLPVGAIDTIFERSFFDINRQDSTDIRWVYRINCHVDLLHVTDSSTFFVEIPRDPNTFGITERTEIIEMRNAYTDTIRRGSNLNLFIAGQNSASHPEYSFPEIAFDQDLKLDVNDSISRGRPSGRAVRIPNLNVIIDNPNDTLYKSYAYFIQFIDSVFFPQISSILIPTDARIFQTFPNPTTRRFSIDLPIDWQSKREGYMLRIYDPTARLIELRRIWYASSLQDLALPASGPTGMYTITLYDERGELAVGRVIKSE